MEKVYIDEERFQQVNFVDKPIAKGNYEYCTFVNCDFQGAKLSDIIFIECEFIDCNLSNANLNKVSFQDVKFKNCKMLGLRFDWCETFAFGVSFENCQLNHSSFYQVRLAKTPFLNCTLEEVDFTECDLTQSVLSNCDFAHAIFDRTVLEKADLRNSINYIIDPEGNQIKDAKFSLSAVAGLLNKYKIKIS